MQRSALRLVPLTATLLVALCWPAQAGERLPPGASSCLGCHAAPQADPAMPDLSQVPADRIAQALIAYRAGERAGTVMPRIAKGFTPQELRAIAAALGRRAP